MIKFNRHIIKQQTPNRIDDVGQIIDWISDNCNDTEIDVLGNRRLPFTMEIIKQYILDEMIEIRQSNIESFKIKIFTNNKQIYIKLIGSSTSLYVTLLRQRIRLFGTYINLILKNTYGYIRCRSLNNMHNGIRLLDEVVFRRSEINDSLTIYGNSPQQQAYIDLVFFDNITTDIILKGVLMNSCELSNVKLKYQNIMNCTLTNCRFFQIEGNGAPEITDSTIYIQDVDTIPDYTKLYNVKLYINGNMVLKGDEQQHILFLDIKNIHKYGQVTQDNIYDIMMDELFKGYIVNNDTFLSPIEDFQTPYREYVNTVFQEMFNIEISQGSSVIMALEQNNGKTNVKLQIFNTVLNNSQLKNNIKLNGKQYDIIYTFHECKLQGINNINIDGLLFSELHYSSKLKISRVDQSTINRSDDLYIQFLLHDIRIVTSSVTLTSKLNEIDSTQIINSKIRFIKDGGIINHSKIQGSEVIGNMLQLSDVQVLNSTIDNIYIDSDRYYTDVQFTNSKIKLVTDDQQKWIKISNLTDLNDIK